MIDIQVHRFRIGIFNLTKCKRTGFSALKKTNFADKKPCRFQLLLIFFSIFSMILIADRQIKKCTFSSVDRSFDMMYKDESVWSNFTGNFFARYVYGNISNSAKGLKAYHVNIRSLKNKIGEIKKYNRKFKTTYPWMF